MLKQVPQPMRDTTKVRKLSEIELDLSVLPVATIDENQKYWLVRTQAGEYYDEFFHDNFIGIGWDKLIDLDEKIFEEDDENILEVIRKTYPEEKQPGRILNQLKRFIFEINEEDIVLIPSHSSFFISFGRVISEVYREEVNVDEVLDGRCPFVRRRKIKWLKTIRREELDPYLYKLLNSHHTITDASPYASYIDRTLHSFYVKGDAAHLVFNVRKAGNIPAVDLIELLSNTMDLIPIVNEISGESFNREDIDIKLTVQSPGIIEIIAFTSPLLVVGMGLLFHYIAGGSYTGTATFTQKEKKIELKSESDGLIKRILEFRKQMDDAKLKEMELKYKMSMEKLHIELPRELKNLPDSIDNKES